MTERELQLVWRGLKLAIEEIQARCESKHLSYVELYRSAYELVIHQRGDQLYNNLKSIVSKHLAGTVVKRVLEYQGSMLDIVNKEWGEHQVVMSMVRDIVLYLDTVYIPEHELEDISEMGFLCFLEGILDHPDIGPKFVDCIVEMIAKDRAGDVVDRAAVKNAVNVLIALDRKYLQCYKEKFETRFLNDSQEYYKALYCEYIMKGDILVYVDRASLLLSQEMKMAEMYLHKSTVSKVSKLVRKEMVQLHISEILEIGPNGVRKMILERRTDNLKQLNDLLGALQGGSEMLLERCIKILREQLEAIYQEERSQDVAGAVTMTTSAIAVNIVQNLVELFKTYQIIAEALENQNNFEEKYMAEFKSFLRTKSNISEYLSLYISNFMRIEKGEKEVSDDVIDAKMDGAMLIFRRLSELDSFEIYYRRHLTNRLIENKSIGYDYERNMVSRFKEVCGWHSTNNIEQMFKDIQLSKDCYDEFKQLQNDASSGIQKTKVDLQVTALWDIKWEVSRMPENINIPSEALGAFECFQLYYLNKHKKKKLKLHCNYGSAELKATFFDADQQPVRTHLLTVSTLVMIILLHFNNRIGLTFDEIRVSTNISEEVLKVMLKRLVFGRQKILRKFPPEEEISPDSLYTVNEDFKTKYHKARIQCSDVNRETAEEKQMTDKIIERGRASAIDAAIVRVMKARQKMQHNPLISEVINILKGVFTPDPVLIKREIELLIEKDYIDRDPESMDTYRYIS